MINFKLLEGHLYASELYLTVLNKLEAKLALKKNKRPNYYKVIQKNN